MNIVETIGYDEVLAQLAEEAAELSQAALKLRRAITGTNPTPRTVQECTTSMNEEIADVRLCLDLLGYNEPFNRNPQNTMMVEKAKRWKKRIAERFGDILYD